MKTPDYDTIINPDRIAWCCGQANITLAELGKALKINPKRLQGGKLTYDEVYKLEQYFGYSQLFFVADGIPKKAAHAVMFRTVANQQGIEMNPSLLKVINNARGHVGTYSAILEEWKGPVSFTPPALSGSIKSKARQVRAWLGLRDGVLYNFWGYRRLIEEREILVVLSQIYSGEFQLDHPKVVGFSMPDGDVPLIFVKRTTPQRQTFTLFHELGHLLLHGKNPHIDSEEALHGGDHAKQEREANTFAARCLIPEATLSDIKTIPKKVEDFDRAFGGDAWRAGVGPEVVVQLLFEEGRIGERQYARYNALQRKRYQDDPPLQARRAPKATRHLEPLEVFGPKHVRMICDAMIDGEVHLADACDYLGGVQGADVVALRKQQIGD